MKHAYLLTGPPGTGKTRLIKEVLEDISDESAGGFYTEEIRGQGGRKGFQLVTLDGQTATLAHIDIKGRQRVGRYGVDLEVIEKIAVPALCSAAAKGQLVVIDEIGRMELMSAAFRKVITDIIKGGHHVLGTITLNPYPRADAIKQLSEVDLVPVTGSNSRQVLEDIQQWLEARETA
jgi:nucleoside-triphosphatase